MGYRYKRFKALLEDVNKMKITNEYVESTLHIYARYRNKEAEIRIYCAPAHQEPTCFDLETDADIENFKVCFEAAYADYLRRKALPDIKDD